MPVKSIVALVALFASTAGCVVAAEAEGEEATASSSDEALGTASSTMMVVGAPDGPMPLDHPVQVPEIRLRVPWQLPAFDGTPEPEEWEHNPRTFGCVMRYVRIFDPRGERIEIPITECR